MGVMPYHVRLAELFTLQKRRDLTEAESLEFVHCLAANAKYCWDIVTLQNMSLAAYIAGDMEWLHSICSQLEALEEKEVSIEPPKKKKPPKGDRKKS